VSKENEMLEYITKLATDANEAGYKVCIGLISGTQNRVCFAGITSGEVLFLLEKLKDLAMGKVSPIIKTKKEDLGELH